MKKIIITLWLMTFMLIVGVNIGKQAMYTAEEVTQLIAEEYLRQSPDRIRLYNQGFRAGAVDHLSILVECEGVTDPAVVETYDTMIRIMTELGELEPGMHCEE